ncbi:hypothetical protein [Rhizohabitans arisaemae]|uniref:hypothetical protein n=1 Tax=Rhizohabitans arisaemae TaxID=2720610 RepID=UPI0024B06379|nr:hypothetical protein [Rhizohabitans arisaemae]
MRSRETWRMGRAVGCLLTAALCDLLMVIGTLVVYLGLQREAKAQIASEGDVATFLGFTLNALPWFIWGCTVVGAIRLAVAALAWRRGGTPGVRVFAVLVLAPSMLVYPHLALLGTIYVDSYYHQSLWWDLVLVLAGAALLCQLAGTGLLFRTAPNRPKGGDTAGRERGRLGPGWVVACLLAASLCGLVAAGFSLVFLPSVRRRAADHESGLVDDYNVSHTLDALHAHLWVYTAAGVIALALAVLVWRRGGTPGVRTLVALAVAPYTMLLVFGPWASINPDPGNGLREEHVGWYADLPWWLSLTAWICYLAGTTLLVFTKPVRPHATETPASPRSGTDPGECVPTIPA